MASVYQRSKKRFSTKRRAWADIGKKTGVKPAQVKPDHTSTHWRWRLKG